MNRDFSPTLLKVAIIDDSAIVVQRLQVLLNEVSNIDFVGFAHNLKTGESLLIERSPDVLILDIHLQHDAPLANGITLLQQVRTQYPQMVIIMLTNFTQQQYREKCLKLGANYFLDKSNEFEKVIDIIKTTSTTQ